MSFASRVLLFLAFLGALCVDPPAFLSRWRSDTATEVHLKSVQQLEQQLGEHVVLEMAGIADTNLLSDEDLVHQALMDASAAGNFSVLKTSSHKFDYRDEDDSANTQHHEDQGGVTMLFLLSESHLSIHTWPERGYAAADVFTCGDVAAPARAVEALLRVFKPERHYSGFIARGIPRAPQQPRDSWL